MPARSLAIRYHAYGDPSVLRLETVETPLPQAGEILIRVRYAGVNPIDWKLRSGVYQKFMPVTFPMQPGIDLAGEVEETGPGVTGWKRGQEVFGIGRGSYAEYAVAAETDVVPVPPRLSLELAAALPVGALTAWQMVETAGLLPGQKVLIQGGAGGVGLFAVQFAKLKGAQVFATTSASNLAFVTDLGAEALDYSLGPLANRVSGLNAVLDTVGGTVLEGSYPLVKAGGVLVTVAGQLSDEKAKTLGIRVIHASRGPTKALSAIADLAAAGQVTAVVQKVFPLAQAILAHELSQSGHGRGRILLKV